MYPHILPIVLAIIACAAAKPSGIVPVLGPGIVTAHSNQVVARTYNGIVTPTVGLLPPYAAPAPRFYPIATPTYVPTYSTSYYPYSSVFRYGYGYGYNYNSYPWGVYGPTIVRYPGTNYW